MLPDLPTVSAIRYPLIWDLTVSTLCDFMPAHRASDGDLLASRRAFAIHFFEDSYAQDEATPLFVLAQGAAPGTRDTTRLSYYNDLPDADRPHAAMAQAAMASDLNIGAIAEDRACRARYDPDLLGTYFEILGVYGALVMMRSSYAGWRVGHGDFEHVPRLLADIEIYMFDALSNHAILEAKLGLEAFLAQHLHSHFDPEGYTSLSDWPIRVEVTDRFL